MWSVCGVPTPTGERDDASGRGAVVVGRLGRSRLGHWPAPQEKVREVLKQIDEGKWPQAANAPGTKDGKPCRNGDRRKMAASGSAVGRVGSGSGRTIAA